MAKKCISTGKGPIISRRKIDKKKVKVMLEVAYNVREKGG